MSNLASFSRSRFTLLLDFGWRPGTAWSARCWNQVVQLGLHYSTTKSLANTGCWCCAMRRDWCLQMASKVRPRGQHDRVLQRSICRAELKRVLRDGRGHLSLAYGIVLYMEEIAHLHGFQTWNLRHENDLHWTGLLVAASLDCYYDQAFCMGPSGLSKRTLGHQLILSLQIHNVDGLPHPYLEKMTLTYHLEIMPDADCGDSSSLGSTLYLATCASWHPMDLRLQLHPTLFSYLQRFHHRYPDLRAGFGMASARLAYWCRETLDPFSSVFIVDETSFLEMHTEFDYVFLFILSQI